MKCIFLKQIYICDANRKKILFRVGNIYIFCSLVNKVSNNENCIISLGNMFWIF